MAKTRKSRSGSKRRGMSRRMKRSMSRKMKKGGVWPFSSGPDCNCPEQYPLRGKNNQGPYCYHSGMYGKIQEGPRLDSRCK